MCSSKPSSDALVMGFGELSSAGSARINLPSSFRAIRDGVTEPVKPGPLRTRVIVAKLAPSNIQCQVPANCSAVFEVSELTCKLIACAGTAPASNVVLVARASAITLARNSENLFSISIIIRTSRFHLHWFGQEVLANLYSWRSTDNRSVRAAPNAGTTLANSATTVTSAHASEKDKMS